jgi:multiple antibiotic resistance protein
VTPLVSDVKFFWEVFVTLLVITDPPGIVPVFIAITADRPPAERHRLAWQAGGLLLLLVALELLAGPGAIVATMLFVQRIGSVGGGVAFGAAIVAVVVVLWLAMRFCGVILRLLRGSGVELLTRIAGLLLSAIAVQLIVNAVRAMIKSGPG